mmetsp:Transcript_31127/g.75224  ORF Transcript_31127/g.75224 Transcript_31127/m.75224 type:complete len:495 (-) Transcript_31127:1337-2821(-)
MILQLLLLLLLPVVLQITVAVVAVVDVPIVAVDAFVTPAPAASVTTRSRIPGGNCFSRDATPSLTTILRRSATLCDEILLASTRDNYRALPKVTALTLTGRSISGSSVGRRRRRTCIPNPLSLSMTPSSSSTGSTGASAALNDDDASTSVPATSATTTAAATAAAAAGVVVTGPPLSTKPDYVEIHGPLGKWIDGLLLEFFKSKLTRNVLGCGGGGGGKTGEESDDDDEATPASLNISDGYAGIIELTEALNARYTDRLVVQHKARLTLRQLFPSWLPPWFAVLFARPFPQFSARLNAWATLMGGTWLMGECELNDVVVVVPVGGEEDEGSPPGTTETTILKNQGLLVKRCRFLEESGCASVCVNSCKVPTQNFFLEDMGLPLRMTPDYETYECQFDFGIKPTAEDELKAKQTPCLERCPTSGALRKYHTATTGGGGGGNGGSTLTTATTATIASPSTEIGQENIINNNGSTATTGNLCGLMMDLDDGVTSVDE